MRFLNSRAKVREQLNKVNKNALLMPSEAEARYYQQTVLEEDMKQEDNLQHKLKLRNFCFFKEREQMSILLNSTELHKAVV